MAKDPIKKADNGTYYFRANLGYNPITGKQIQKYRSGFKTKKEAREEYSKLVLTSTEELTAKKDTISFQTFIEKIYLPWYKMQIKENIHFTQHCRLHKQSEHHNLLQIGWIEKCNRNAVKKEKAANPSVYRLCSLAPTIQTQYSLLF